MEIKEKATQVNGSVSHSEIYDGEWERKDRSLNAAAVFGLLGIGVLYFNAQTILATFGVMITTALSPDIEITGDFWERLQIIFDQFSTPILASVMISQYLFMLLPVWFLVRHWHTRRFKEYIRFHPGTIAEILLAMAATIAIIPTGTFISNSLVQWLNIPTEFYKYSLTLFTADSTFEFIFLVLVIAITPAICEEVFFRGYVQRTFERTMNWKSVILVGVVFGLFHMQPLGLITLSLLGILFGYFYFRSKSLLPAIAAHFTNNFLVILLLYKAPSFDNIDLASAEQIPLSWVFITLPISMILLFFFHRLTAGNAEKSL